MGANGVYATGKAKAKIKPGNGHSGAVAMEGVSEHGGEVTTPGQDAQYIY